MSDDEMTFGELSRILGRIEKKLDEVTNDHERRLRAVERWMWTAMGLSAAGAGTGIWSLLGG
jgi:hypothetical protein